jgi:hypothetical protein
MTKRADRPLRGFALSRSRLSSPPRFVRKSNPCFSLERAASSISNPPPTVVPRVGGQWEPAVRRSARRPGSDVCVHVETFARKVDRLSAA